MSKLDLIVQNLGQIPVSAIFEIWLKSIYYLTACSHNFSILFLQILLLTYPIFSPDPEDLDRVGPDLFNIFNLNREDLDLMALIKVLEHVGAATLVVTI